jgi:N-acetyl sugar amidotransferase
MNNYADYNISFDENGFCNYCKKALSQVNTTVYFPNEIGAKKLDEMISKIKKENKNKSFDCIMGLSGGLDSSYLAYLGHKWGLRILAVHIDDGYDTVISKNNLEKIINKANIELINIRPDEKQYNALILAYMKAGVPNLAIPQDNILFAFLYDQVVKEKVKYFLSGGNFALESILPKNSLYNNMDVINIKNIAKDFSSEGIDKLKFISTYQKYLNIKLGRAITLRPLNYIDYNSKKAIKELYDFCEFEYYGAKHLENILTAFVQLYWLPEKFNLDTRSSYLSSMIISNQITRGEALKELEKPLYDERFMNKYIEFIKNKLHISEIDFQSLMNNKSHRHEDYPTEKIVPFIRKIFFKSS